MTSKTKTDIQRRQFLKTAGLSVGAAAVAGTVLSPKPAKAKTAGQFARRTAPTRIQNPYEGPQDKVGRRNGR